MPYCSKCGEKKQNASALKLHEVNCKGEREEDKGAGAGECELCKGALKLLSPRVSNQKEAIDQGFSTFCVKCKELY